MSDEKTLDDKQLDMLRMIADTHHRTECASWKLLWLIDQHRALTAALATRQRERDAARDIWFCLECGITVPDAEHCCPTCGRDCIGFENGKPAHGMGAWLDKERALDAALAYQLKSPVTGAEQTLGHLMQERYGREARQWQANHDQRKAERDAAITERDALRGEVERLKADLGAAQATADDRFKWRHVVERETAEAIAAFVDTEAEARREEGFSYRAVSELAADIRSGSWKEPK